jgi:hypothetical protein
MTEQEWLACAKPEEMLEFLGSKASDRKIRMLACGCCRRASSLAYVTDLLAFIEIAEEYADGLRDLTNMEAANVRAAAIRDSAEAARKVTLQNIAHAVTWATDREHSERGIGCAGYAVAQKEALAGRSKKDRNTRYVRAYLREHEVQGTLVRDVFGNPFRLVSVDLPWLTTTVVSLAKAIYHERAFDRLPILADALEEAGCTNADLLAHCRGPGPHVRGCWVVDSILGRE